MRRGHLLPVLVLALAACRPSPSPLDPPASAGPDQLSAPLRGAELSKDPPAPAASLREPAARSLASASASAFAGHGPAPLFWYREDGDVVAFWSPQTVVITRAGDGGAPRTCKHDLPGDKGGNMYSGREVEGAFRHPDVQKVFAGPHTAPYSSAHPGELGLGGGGDPVVWVAACDKCMQEPDGLLRFHDVLRVVMVNQRAMCP